MTSVPSLVCPQPLDTHLYFLIPLAGPWMGMARCSERPGAWFEVVGFATLGLAQAGGTLAILSGLVFQRQEPVDPGPVSVSLGHRGAPGLDLSVRF